MRSWTLAVGLAAITALTACTPNTPSAAPDPTPTPTANSTAAPTAPTVLDPTPRRGDCYRLRTDQLTLTSNDAKPVPCSKPHTVETVAVLKGTRLSNQAASDACRQAVARHLGAGSLELAATMAKWVWFVPSDSTSSWVSCDLVVFAHGSTLLKLPRRTKGWYHRAPDQLRICGTAAPAARGFERVICSRPHSWRVLQALPLAGKRYPGKSSVRKAGDQRCSDAVRSSLGYPLQFSYGWEWPTAAQWAAGQHFGLCWTSSG